MRFQKILILITFGGLSCGGNSGLVVSGKVEGLNGTLIIQNNGKDDVTLEKDGTFSFKVADKSDYDIQMFREPCEQRCEIKNGKGAIDQKSVDDVHIICLVKQWSETEQFLKGTEFEDKDTFVGQTAMDKRGNIIVTLTTTKIIDGVGSVNQLYKSEFRSGEWHFPREDENLQISESNIGSRIAMNDNNGAIITWTQNSLEGKRGVFKSEYQYGVWTKPSLLNEQISFVGVDADYPEVEMDDSGDIIIVWSTRDSFTFAGIGVYKAERRKGKWTYPTDENDKVNMGSNIIGTPRVAMNNKGEAIIAWVQANGNNEYLFISEYTNGYWQKPKSIDDYVFSGHPRLGELKMNDSGDIVIGYYNSFSSEDSKIFISEKRGGIWHHPSSTSDYINPEGEIAALPQVRIAENGDTVIVWMDVNMADQDNFKTFKSEYRNRKWDWPIFAKDVVNSGEYLSKPMFSMDQYGNAMINWIQWNGTDNYDLLGKEYGLDHWSDPKSYGSVNNSEYDWGDSSYSSTANECRKIIFWPVPNDGNGGIQDEFYFSQYR